MLRNCYHFIAVMLLLFSCQPSEGDRINSLKEKIEAKFSSIEGDFALAFIHLDKTERLMINEKKRFHAASTMKTPVMIEAFKQSKAGKFNLGDSITIKNEFKSIVDGSLYSLSTDDDSEDGLYEFIGKNRTYFQLIYDMIIASSNLATNIMIDELDAKKVTATMRELGADSIEVLRGVEDIKAYRQGLSNTTNAYDLAIIFEQLALYKIVDPKASEFMIDILLDQKWKDVIPKHLPPNVRVAHKTGWITGLQHDSGIVYIPDGPKYVLVILSANMTEFDKGKAMLADVSKLVFDHVQSTWQK